MRNFISILFCLVIALAVPGCAQPPGKASNSPDEQRSHAREAQDELSSAVQE